ncbi:hypothetical protein IW262DRAFT_1292089 [Armillaria fumosa]|nr:hypothetical protein IW262DRAFT_1292089 [Armillaria fumosa]
MFRRLNSLLFLLQYFPCLAARIAVVMEDAVVRRICTKEVVIPVPDQIESHLASRLGSIAALRRAVAATLLESYMVAFTIQYNLESAVNTKGPNNGEVRHILQLLSEKYHPSNLQGSGKP